MPNQNKAFLSYLIQCLNNNVKIVKRICRKIGKKNDKTKAKIYFQRARSTNGQIGPVDLSKNENG